MRVPRLGPFQRQVDADAEDPEPNTWTENDVEIETLKWNGENSISASNPECPLTDRALKPKKYSARVPNCTVLVVTAK